MNIVENTFFKEIRPLLGRQFFNAAQLVQQGVGIEGVNHAVDLGRRRLIAIFKKHYKRVATVFSRRAYQIFEESKKSIYPDSYKQIDFAIELKGPKDEFWNSIGKWSTTEAAKKIRKIQRTTKGVIARVIHKGMQEGESHLDIAKRIRKTSAAINPHRSRTIALTETHGAAVKAVDTAVASTRIEMEREWISAKDDRTRTRDKSNRFEHFRSFPNGADGEKVAQDGKFVGTGQALDYPGDSKGSAGNVILCRCVLIYHTVKRTEQLKPHEPERIPSFIPARNIKEAEERFNNLGIQRISKPGSGRTTWKTEKAFVNDALNPILEELTRLEQEFPDLIGLLKKKKLWDLEFYRGKNLSPALVQNNINDIEGLYNEVQRRIRFAMSDVAKKAKPHLSSGRALLVGKDFRTGLRHELGHHFERVVMMDHEGPLQHIRSKFIDVWEKLGKDNYFKKKVSGYSGTNLHEAFAESFSAYTSPLYGTPKKLKLPKEIENIFNHLLKGK